jgi:hypothetical protein
MQKADQPLSGQRVYGPAGQAVLTVQVSITVQITPASPLFQKKLAGHREGLALHDHVSSMYERFSLDILLLRLRTICAAVQIVLLARI